MSEPRIALIGDTRLDRGGEFDRVAAIAVELANGWDIEPTLRTVAANVESWDRLDAVLGEAGVTAQMTVRSPAEYPSADYIGASIRKGDPLDIAELFGHDIVILDIDDAPLRRFLTDLPAHTRPDVRLLSPLRWVLGTRHPDDLDVALRFDAVVGNDEDYISLTVEEEDDYGTLDAYVALGRVHERMRGSNLRAAILRGRYGSFTLAMPDDEPNEFWTMPADHAPFTRSPRPEAAFIASIAVGMARRDDWVRIGKDAMLTFADVAQEISRSRRS